MLLDDLIRSALAGEHTCDGLLGQLVVELTVGDQLLDFSHIGRSDRQLFEAHALVVGFTAQLAQPPLLGTGCSGTGLDGFLKQIQSVGVEHIAHLQIVEAPLALQAVAALTRHFRHLGLHLFDVLLGDVQHHQIRIREVTVIVGVGLHAAAGGGLRSLIPVSGFLQNLAAFAQNGRLTANLILNGLFNATERVHVLGFGTSAERVGRAVAQRHVHIGAHIALLHTSVGDVQRTHDVADGAHIGACDFGGTVSGAFDRLGHDLDQRHACTVVVDQGVIGTFDTAVSATDVGVLTGVVFDVGAFDRHAEHGAVFKFHIKIAVAVGRLVVLRDLVIARHIRVEVVLTCELAPFSDFAMQGKTQLDRIIDSGLVDHRQRARQTKTHRGELAVRIAAERDFGRAEQLRGGAQLNMGFQTDDRVELLDGIGVLHQLFSHFVFFPPMLLTCSSRQATGFSGTARSGRSSLPREPPQELRQACTWPRRAAAERGTGSRPANRHRSDQQECS